MFFPGRQFPPGRHRVSWLRKTGSPPRNSRPKPLSPGCLKPAFEQRPGHLICRPQPGNLQPVNLWLLLAGLRQPGGHLGLDMTGEEQMRLHNHAADWGPPLNGPADRTKSVIERRLGRRHKADPDLLPGNPGNCCEAPADESPELPSRGRITRPATNHQQRFSIIERR